MDTQPAAASIPRELENRYKDISGLGAGASGAVFKAHDINLDKTVAIKVLKYDQLQPDKIVRFQREAKLASKLKHHNLVTVMDFGVLSRGEPYLVMDYVDGISLQAILDEQHVIPLLPALHIIMQICQGMEHAHNSGVIHRDLKPSNVIVTGDSLIVASARVLDFGIAKLDENSSSNQELTRTGGIIGTPYYMSPEQFDAQKTIDRRSDIYSIGSMLFHMLTGFVVFDGDTILDIVNAQKSKPAPRLKDVRDDDTISDTIENVVARCLERDPDKRYQTVADLIGDIAPTLEHLRSQADTVKAEKQVVRELAVDLQFNPAQAKGLEQAQSRRRMLKISALIVACAGALVTVLALRPEQATVDADKDKSLKKEEKLKRQRDLGKYFKLEPTGDWTVIGEVNDEDLKMFVEGKTEIKSLIFHEQCADKITEDGFRTLASIPIRRLALPNGSVTDEELRIITSMKSLVGLDANTNPLTSKGLNFPSDSPIKELGLSFTSIDDDASNEIARLKSLEVVDFSKTRITDQMMDTLSKLPKLKALYVGDTKVTDSGVALLANNRTITELGIGGTKATDAAIRSIKHLPLQSVNFDGSKSFDDKSLEMVCDYFPGLYQLTISDTNVKGKGLKAVTKLKKVLDLDMCTLKLKDVDVTPVFGLKNVRFINLIANDLTDRSLTGFAKMPGLKKICINQNVRVTPDAVRELRRSVETVEAFDIEGPHRDGLQEFAEIEDPNLQR